MPTTSRLPRFDGALAWSGFVLSLLTLGLWVADGPRTVIPPVVAIVLATSLLRRRPWVALGLMLGEMVAVGGVDLVWPYWSPGLPMQIRILQTLVVDLAVLWLAATRLRLSVVAAALALTTQLVLTGIGDFGSLEESSTRDVLAMASAWMIGNTIRLRRQYKQARRAQAEVQAVQAERLRIARELHDMVAHSIGVIAIQAGVGGRVIDTQPDEARNALRAIEDTSRETLAGLRRMLTALRHADAEPVSSTPGLADLAGLVARSAEVGVRVDVQWSGDRRPLPPDVDLSAYRIIQEAVTNVVRHAHTHQCRVVLDQRDDELSIEVTDDGKGGVEGAGYGIPGMRERVALLSGTFTAGPRPAGGFRVAARIPAVTR